MTPEEKAQLLDWASACESAYFVQATQGLAPSVLQGKRDALVAYVASLLDARQVEIAALKAAQPS